MLKKNYLSQINYLYLHTNKYYFNKKKIYKYKRNKININFFFMNNFLYWKTTLKTTYKTQFMLNILTTNLTFEYFGYLFNILNFVIYIFDLLYCKFLNTQFSSIEYYFLTYFNSIQIKFLLNNKFSIFESSSNFWNGAIWLERELLEFYQIYFLNLKDTRRLLTNYLINKTIKYSNYFFEKSLSYNDNTETLLFWNNILEQYYI